MRYGMPMEEVTARIFGHVMGKVIGWFFNILFSKPLTYTGLWPFVILFILFAVHPTREWSDTLAMPIFLSWIFAAFWTSRNIYLSIKGKGAKAGGNFDGVYFGEFERTIVGKPAYEDGHVLIIGGPGSGKSAGIVIPTLKYFWSYPFFAVDIKGELEEKSLRKGHVFNPCNPGASGYDPFYIVKQSGNEAASIREIAITLVPEKLEVREPFWIRAAQNILTGYLLTGYRSGETFINLLKCIQSDPPEVTLKLACTDDQASMYVSQYSGIKDEILSGIMSELSNHIVPFIGDPDIEASLSKPDIITPELLEKGENIFLQVPETRIEQWKPLITLIIQQFLAHCQRRPEGSSVPILFMLDEFPRFGKMEGILHGLATLRSKKVTICLVVQSLAQLDSIYGQEQRKVIADNCSYKAIYIRPY